MNPGGQASEELADFVEVLRRSGYDVGAEQYVSAQRLLVTLAAGGDRLGRPRELTGLLAPILCTSREEQESFPLLYERWLDTRPALFAQQPKPVEPAAPPHRPAPAPEATAEARPPSFLRRAAGETRRLGRPPRFATAISFLALIVIVFPLASDWFKKSAPTAPDVAPTPAPPGTPPSLLPSWEMLLTSAAVLILVAAALWWLSLWWRRRLELKKWRTGQRPRLERLKVKGEAEHLKRLFPLRRIAQELRHYRQHVAHDLDVRKTVEATLGRGLFTPAYAPRKSLPEYLVLIDRVGFDDQQAQLIDGLVGQLADNGLFIDRYFFQGDPTVCSTDGPRPRYHTLHELAARYTDHHLLVFSDAGGFFSPLTGRPREWLSAFATWETRVLLTPEFRPGEYRAWALAEWGFEVMPADLDGLAALGHAVHGGTPPSPRGGVRPLPPMLQGRAWGRESGGPPDARHVQLLCRQLEEFLGEEGCRWLSACAVYPLLQLDLTLELGNRLVGESRLPETFSTLLRLPWFRLGSMPDWLRERLILGMTPEHEQSVRRALTELLVSSLHTPEGFALRLVSEPPEAKGRVPRRGTLGLSGEELRDARRALDILKSAPEGSPLRDYVLVGFAEGRRPNRLALTLPDEMRSTFYPKGLAGRGAWLVRALIALVVLFSVGLLLVVVSVAETLTAVISSLVITCWAALNVGTLRQLMAPPAAPIFAAASGPDWRLSNLSGRLRRDFSTSGLLGGGFEGAWVAGLENTSPRFRRRAGEPLSLHSGASSSPEQPAEPATHADARAGEWTGAYERFAPEIQRRWRALAVFPGSFDAQAAAIVWEGGMGAAPPILLLLDALVGDGLLKRSDDEGRYRLPEPLRPFAGARLSAEERSIARFRHAAHYRDVLSSADRLYLRGGDDIMRALALFKQEWHNIQAGQSWAAKQFGADILAEALCTAYPEAGAHLLRLRQTPREQVVWLEAALASAARRPGDRAVAGRHLGRLGDAYVELGEPRRAIKFYRRALDVALATFDGRNEVEVLGGMGVAFSYAGKPSRGIALCKRSLEAARRRADDRAAARALGRLGIAYDQSGEPSLGVDFHERYFAAACETGNRRGEGQALGNIGTARARMGEARRALGLYGKCLVIARELGDRGLEANALFNSGLAFEGLGDRAQAIVHAAAALDIYDDLESPRARAARAALARWRGESELLDALPAA